MGGFPSLPEREGKVVLYLTLTTKPNEGGYLLRVRVTT